MAFYDFMQKLILARQINFQKGKIELLKQRLSVFPTSVFVELIENNPSIIPDVYSATKESAKSFAGGIKEKHKFSGQQLKTWLKDIIEFAGWGEAEFHIYDENNFKALVYVRDSSAAFLAKKKDFVDHSLRGFFAGGGSISMGKELECIEVKCKAKGDSLCEFRVGLLKDLKKEYPDFVKSQLWWLNEKRK